MIRMGTRFRQKKADSHYDAIVIGSGIGGLCNAALLSKLGKKVCVLEQHYTAGGYTHVYERNGYEWDVGVHYIGEVHKPWSVIRRIFDTITDAQLKWAPMDPLYDEVVIGKETYPYYAGREEFKREMKRRFPAEAAAIDTYVEMLAKVSSMVPRFFAGQAMPRFIGRLYNRLRRYFMPAYFFKTTYEVLSELTDNRELIGVLTAQWGDYGLPPKKSAFMMHGMVAKHYITGGNYPVGGAGRIAETIIPVIQRSGGEVFTYASVEEILVRDNRAYGVRLKKGEVITADAVVSGVGLFPTVERLLPPGLAKKHGYDRQLRQLQVSAAHLCLYAGFKGSAEALGLPKKNFWVYPGYDHDQNLVEFNDDIDTDMPLVYISFPSAKDPTWDERYPDKATVEVVALAKPEWFEKWLGSTWNKRGDDYEALKQKLIDRLLAALYRQMPQLEDALDYCELSTPLSTQWFQWNQAGEIYGIEHTVKRFRQDWLHPVTPIKNLYLTGSDVLTAGVGGALMGGVMTTAAMMGWRGYKVMKLLRQAGVETQAPADLSVAPN
ncbi:NAD(P)/FAD-dependent oxidoreductase [Exilibacterium tricleocarpae]|uniref:NAD(P)/FAD-dependent oxidoreductase n=1 Tax=Exilibacterium tricleocarpae TaxID=2591008 RepID=A0A545T650_9GAMM|nr:NAD(P)/FAD-dependent oxidoreductase [Exilibacterium tricleocarpae]TQV72694.1 NAD(P)/FAD-dependent oxidoreductase [Exilibacterium tricleocarpae]